MPLDAVNFKSSDYSKCSKISILSDYRTCQEDDIKCGNGLCVPTEKSCDGYFDCRDKKDEEGCEGTSCDLSEFRCANGEKCIAEFQKCNHRKECTDGSDESDCSKLKIILPDTDIQCIHNVLLTDLGADSSITKQ